MFIRNQITKLNKENGSITLFVIVSMLFFILILSSTYMLSSAGQQSGISETTKIKEIYEKDLNQIDDIYATIEGTTALKEKGIYVSLKESILCFYDNEQDAKEGVSEENYFGDIQESTFLRKNTPWYEKRDNIKEVVFYNDIKPNNTAYWFSDLTNLNKISNIERLDTSKVINMNWMFGNCPALTSLDVSNFQTGNVTSMDAMFYNCQLLTTLDVSNFDVKNVTNMNSMFNNCRKIEILDLTNFNTSKVTNMDNMLSNMLAVNTIYVGAGWTTENATTIDMFANSKVQEVTPK